MSKDYRKPAMETLADKADRFDGENRFWFQVCLHVCIDNPKVFLDSVAKAESVTDRLKVEKSGVDWLSSLGNRNSGEGVIVKPHHDTRSYMGSLVKPSVPVINVLEDEKRTNGVTRLPGYNYNLTDPEVTRQATTFLRMHHGQKILAIKEVRTMTGAGLTEAKSLVDRLLESMDKSDVFFENSSHNPGYWVGKYDHDFDFGRIHPTDERVKETAIAFILINQTINGIKAILAMTGLGLKEAKELFDSFKASRISL